MEILSVTDWPPAIQLDLERKNAFIVCLGTSLITVIITAHFLMYGYFPSLFTDFRKILRTMIFSFFLAYGFADFVLISRTFFYKQSGKQAKSSIYLHYF